MQTTLNTIDTISRAFHDRAVFERSQGRDVADSAAFHEAFGYACERSFIAFANLCGFDVSAFLDSSRESGWRVNYHCFQPIAQLARCAFPGLTDKRVAVSPSLALLLALIANTNQHGITWLASEQFQRALTGKPLGYDAIDSVIAKYSPRMSPATAKVNSSIIRVAMSAIGAIERQTQTINGKAFDGFRLDRCSPAIMALCPVNA